MAYIKVINNTKTFPSGDETTGALDFETGRAVMQILQDMSRKQGSTVLIVTHNAALAPIANQVIHDGRVKEITHQDHPQDIATLEW
ncbi:hypothetical protein HMPREF0513_00653 [Limosilactobacillus fermentum 28-3-CHN]|uniref:ABC transporter, ATP-binding protein n=2 Tax=Limosilactobacillus fermentum TaxID=1613 RepID=D0DSL4_LIMFE|nr:hypothetical protein HMPREF0513_00653 [Limosilactobacillus fermentum 28-3-CHN]